MSQVEIKEPRVKISYEIKPDDGPAIIYSSEEVPMSIQDQYQAVLGNGLAKVAVTVDISVKDFGTGASGSCTVVLTCNQDEKTLAYTANLAGEFARAAAKHHQGIAEAELTRLLEERRQQKAMR